jgi:hypothetical protein
MSSLYLTSGESADPGLRLYDPVLERQAIHARPCPYCGSEIGVGCRTAGDAPTSVHVDRYEEMP